MVVVAERLNLVVGPQSVGILFAINGLYKTLLDNSDAETFVVKLGPTVRALITVPAPATVPIKVSTSQSPAVREIEVIVFAEGEVIETAEPLATEADTYSPTTPEDASLFVGVPITPLVVGLNVMLVAVAAPSVLFTELLKAI